MNTPWQAFLNERFPGYLLPSAQFERLSTVEAERFLQRLSDRRQLLGALRAISALGPNAEALEAFTRDVSDLIRRLPSKAEVTRRTWRGGFVGRLDVRATLALHLSGDPTAFVTQNRARTFELPENLLLRSVCARLEAALGRARQVRPLEKIEWMATLGRAEATLRAINHGTILREVPLLPVTTAQESAARAARHSAYSAALRWHEHLRSELETEDESTIARVIAERALLPLSEATKFELAVLIRLLEGLERHLREREPGRWKFQRCLLAADRDDVASFEREDGAALSVFYNHAYLDAGPVEGSALHYLGHSGRMRPDITVVCRDPSGSFSAVVVEIKHSEDRGYVLAGLHEAHLYATEYARHLCGWPKAILVCLGETTGLPRETDDVIALSWRDWIPEGVTAGIVELAARGSGAASESANFKP